jgi:protein required for attachment to host cells
MSDVCVVIADGARARFFSLEAADFPEVQSGPTLVEHEGLSNADALLPGKEKYSDNKTGRNQSAAGIAHGYDDHRDRHDAENERRFAQQIVEATLKLADAKQPRNLILAAEKQMLGMLRQALPSAPRIEIKELAKDLTKLSAHELHQYLAGEKMVPPRVNRG